MDGAAAPFADQLDPDFQAGLAFYVQITGPGKLFGKPIELTNRGRCEIAMLAGLHLSHDAAHQQDLGRRSGITERA
jgi:hypothetical protein